MFYKLSFIILFFGRKYVIRSTIIFFSILLFVITFNAFAQESTDSENKGHAEYADKLRNPDYK